MKVTFASVFLVVVVLATSMSSAEGRKTSRRARGYNEDDALLEQYANAGLGRDLKGKKKNSNIFKSAKCSKADGPTCMPSAKPSVAPSISAVPSGAPTVSNAPSVSNAPTRSKGSKASKGGRRSRRRLQ